jgi:hypothetical protein
MADAAKPNARKMTTSSIYPIDQDPRSPLQPRGNIAQEPSSVIGIEYTTIPRCMVRKRGYVHHVNDENLIRFSSYTLLILVRLDTGFKVSRDNVVCSVVFANLAP